LEVPAADVATSVASNWEAEAARFAPELKIAGISDTLRKRGQDLEEIVAGADVVVTTYTLFRLDFEAYSGRAWSALLLDEAQAVDRAHRIGQTRNVMAYRLIAKDTIEQKVMALKARKAELFSSVGQR
jgi:SNF2 family DNA or RNA helicase